MMPDSAAVPPRDGSRGAHVDITLPLDTRFIATLRMLSASLAADAGFSVDEIDDLRLAVSEVWSMIAEQSSDGRIAARFEVGDASLTVRFGLDSNTTATEISVDTLGANILRAVVDSYSIGHHEVTITKHAAEVAAS